MNEFEFKNNLKHWLINKSKKNLTSVEDLTFDYLLLENGIINSLQVMDLILYLQNSAQINISVDQLKPDSFKSINAIYENFVKATL